MSKFKRLQTFNIRDNFLQLLATEWKKKIRVDDAHKWAHHAIWNKNENLFTCYVYWITKIENNTHQLVLAIDTICVYWQRLFLFAFHFVRHPNNFICMFFWSGGIQFCCCCCKDESICNFLYSSLVSIVLRSLNLHQRFILLI